MLFALNYSPQAQALIDEGRIDIDLYKCPDWPELITAAQQQRQTYVHFPIVLGQNRVADLDLNAVENWLMTTDTRFINTHIDPRHADLPSGIDADGVIAIMVRELEVLTQRFGMERVIAENVPLPYTAAGQDPVPLEVQPEVIYTTIDAAGCGFLLDLSHAALTCERSHYTLETYISLLPVDRLRELHVTGLGTHPEGWRTDHLGLAVPDWARLHWALDCIRSGEWAHPEVMAFEYGGIGPMFTWRSEAQVIAEQVPQLYALAHSLDPQAQP